MLYRQALLGALAFCLISSACKREEQFKDLNGEFSGPIDAGVSDSGSHFYILNTDFDRTYNTGSISVLDEQGNKVNQIKTPRMGRSLTTAGSDMIITYDRADEDNGPRVELWDISTPEAPVRTREWIVDCSPFNAALRKDYKHFAVTCTSGSIFVGTLTDDRSQSTLKKVRNYGVSRRAIYIDPERELLLGFATDMDAQAWHDGLYNDAKTFDPETATEIKQQTTDENGEPTGVSIRNEVPDLFEDTKRALANEGQRLIYQFFVYDFAAERDSVEDCEVTAEEDCIFPRRPTSDPIVQQELRWLYFQVRNFDGSPDLLDVPDTTRYYRTNFWDAVPDPDDPSSFYLSHRGPPLDEINKGSPYANHVVRATIVGNLRGDGETVPKTEDVLTFERVYGFKGENKDLHYPGDIAVGYVAGQKVLVTNHFRDLDNWVREDVYFSIAVKLLDSDLWWQETPNNFEPLESYFQLAMNQNGVVVSPSFYGNQVMVLQIKPGVGIDVRSLK